MVVVPLGRIRVPRTPERSDPRVGLGMMSPRLDTPGALGRDRGDVAAQSGDPGATAVARSGRAARVGRSLRILHVVQGYAPAIGGTERVVQRLSEEIVRQYGDEVTVFTT